MRKPAVCAALSLYLLIPLSVHAQTDWPSYGNDAGGMRYSALTQMNPNNVGQLRRAWTFLPTPTSIRPVPTASVVSPVHPEPGPSCSTPASTSNQGFLR